MVLNIVGSYTALLCSNADVQYTGESHLIIIFITIFNKCLSLVYGITTIAGIITIVMH